MTDQVKTDEAILDKVAKLLKLAAKAGTPEEAAAAAAKAQDLMTQYNLTEVALEKRTGKVDGRREQAFVEGGHYAFQRDLFEAVAKMNFCISWNENYWTTVDFTREGGYNEQSGRYKKGYRKGDSIRKSRFKLVGRMANTAATRVMFNYLMASITRILRERVRRSDGVIPKGSMMDSWAVSFREGAVSDLMQRIWESRKESEKARQAELKAQARMAGGTTSTSLTLRDVEESEHAANYDEIYGEGAFARRMQAREEAAAKRRLEEKRMAKLAKENPEEFKRIEAERRKAARSVGSGGSTRERYVDPSAYRAGREAAKEISLNQQVHDKKPLSIGRSK